MIKASAADKLQLNRSNEDLVLVEVKSNGERTVFKDFDVSVPTALYLNARIFVSSKDHIDALVSGSFCQWCIYCIICVCLFPSHPSHDNVKNGEINGFLFLFWWNVKTPLPEQEEITEGIPLELEHLGTKELAYHITQFDWDLFWSIHEYELLYHTFGRHHFGKVSAKCC